MKCKAVAVVGLLFLSAVGIGRSELEQPGTTVAGETLRLDMSRQEAMKEFAACCKTIPLGDNQVIIQNKRSVSYELGGMIYFDRNKVTGLAADRNWSSDAAPYDTALTLYRLVDERSHGTAVRAMVYAYSREASNARSKYVVIQFPDGRRVRLEMTHLNPDADISQQVVVSECVGNCSDW